jgi:hypothetical protein
MLDLTHLMKENKNGHYHFRQSYKMLLPCWYINYQIRLRDGICKSFMEPRNRSQPGGPVQQPYLSYRPARLHGLAKSIPRNRFLGSINVYKYGLRNSPQNQVLCSGGTKKAFLNFFLHLDQSWAFTTSCNPLLLISCWVSLAHFYTTVTITLVLAVIHSGSCDYILDNPKTSFSCTEVKCLVPDWLI